MDFSDDTNTRTNTKAGTEADTKVVKEPNRSEDVAVLALEAVHRDAAATATAPQNADRFPSAL